MEYIITVIGPPELWISWHLGLGSCSKTLPYDICQSVKYFIKIIFSTSDWKGGGNFSWLVSIYHISGFSAMFARVSKSWKTLQLEGPHNSQF